MSTRKIRCLFIYLASTSPRRKALLEKAGIRFRILKPGYQEKRNIKAFPSEIVRLHALRKAQSCLKQVKEGILLAADTLVYLDGEIIGKPRNRKHAHLILKKLQGRWHSVYTGVAIFKIVSSKVVQKKVFFEKTKVRLKALTPQGIRNYFKKVNPLDKAGAYAIQSPHGGIVQDVKGSFSNAVGLPVEKVLNHLKLALCKMANSRCFSLRGQAIIHCLSPEEHQPFCKRPAKIWRFPL